ncbi:EGF-like repeat and discoidin I-like domain-containing protein 3 [Eriocheir sinensis]|uniref:EGF-like repeat and discoidin I-like domain-containing protein 3 n=1 Tax=Eriocheir sinensis TaxID=95602 RepID=UPI0021C6C443|nr:EGF-like repeat and discoidin I-like domain-containing protein 3 [Eriocheir sinensis]
MGSNTTPSLQLLLLTLLACVLLPALLSGVGACEPEQLVQGCRLEEGGCVCGLGCDTTFRYATREQCQAALKEQQQDPCETKPCRNGGLCSQISRDPGYQCLCVNTGYYGRTCHKKCPSPKQFSSGLDTRFPVDCMVI